MCICGNYSYHVAIFGCILNPRNVFLSLVATVYLALNRYPNRQ
jgi:hypothetical protein